MILEINHLLILLNKKNTFSQLNVSNNSSSLNSYSINVLKNTVITESKIDTNVMAVIENLPNLINYTLYLKYLFSYLEINEFTISYVSLNKYKYKYMQRITFFHLNP